MHYTSTSKPETKFWLKLESRAQNICSHALGPSRDREQRVTVKPSLQSGGAAELLWRDHKGSQSLRELK